MKKDADAPRVVIYTRISSDPDETEAGVRRQEQDCRAYAKLRGYKVVGTTLVE